MNRITKIIGAGLLAIGLVGLASATITHTIQTSYSTQSSGLTGTQSYTADTERNSDLTVTNGVNTMTTWLSATNAQTLCLSSTVNLTCIVKNGDTTNNTVTLTANSPNVSVGSNQVYSVLLGVKATSFVLLATNTGTFSVRALIDNTP